MENLVNDWKDRQEIHERHVVETSPEVDFSEVLKDRLKAYERKERGKVIAILERYNSILKEEEPDYDLWDILPRATDKFLLKYYPKI